jgi:hypothetical protein
MDRPLGSQEEGLHLTLTQPILYLGSLATLFFFFLVGLEFELRVVPFCNPGVLPLGLHLKSILF